MVDPQPSRVAQLGANGLDERPISDLAQPMRDERRQRPVLAGRVEPIRRRADRRAEGELLLPVPRVEAAGIDADGHVGDAPQVGRGRRELEVEAPLHPGVEGDAVRRLGRHLLRRRSIGLVEHRRPRLPARPMTLGEHAEEGPSLQGRDPRAARQASNAARSNAPCAHVRSSARIFMAIARRRSTRRPPLRARPASASSSSSVAPGISSARSASGLPKRLVLVKYGLGSGSAVGFGAPSGLTVTKPAPTRRDHPASSRRSPRSPMPHDRRDRVVGSWTAQPHSRSRGGRWQCPGPAIRSESPPSSRVRRW